MCDISATPLAAVLFRMCSNKQIKKTLWYDSSDRSKCKLRLSLSKSQETNSARSCSLQAMLSRDS
jgi:hypothetical protein